MAHTFPEGIPQQLIGVNTPRDNKRGNLKRIVTDENDYYLDIAWPIFSGKAGVLRIGLSEKPNRSQIVKISNHARRT